jgi:hypothetical protein
MHFKNRGTGKKTHTRTNEKHEVSNFCVIFTDRCWYFGWIQLLDIWFLLHARHYIQRVSTSKYIFFITATVAIFAITG